LLLGTSLLGTSVGQQRVWAAPSKRTPPSPQAAAAGPSANPAGPPNPAAPSATPAGPPNPAAPGAGTSPPSSADDANAQPATPTVPQRFDSEEPRRQPRLIQPVPLLPEKSAKPARTEKPARPEEPEKAAPLGPNATGMQDLPPFAVPAGPPPPARPASRLPAHVSTSTDALPAHPPALPEAKDSANKKRKPAPSGLTEELIKSSQGDMSFYELVDEMLDEVAYQLGKQDALALSPLAIRLVRLSPDLEPEFAATLQARLLARITNTTGIKTTLCVECTSLRSRVEDGQWLVTLGAVRQEDLRRVAAAQGITTFLDLDFTYSPRSNVIWMEAVAFRARDGSVQWTDAYRSDATTAALLRTGRRLPSREERLAELEGKIAARPSYGYSVALGMMKYSYDGPTGDIMGPQATIRIHERFGEEQSQLFGLSVGIFSTGAPSQNGTSDISKGSTTINSVVSGAYYSQRVTSPNLNRPELWPYVELGGIFSGNQGNTGYGEAGLDLHLKWRFSLVGGLMYVLPTKFAYYDLGGLGWRLRLAFNW